MNRLLIGGFAFAASTGLAFAAEDNNATGKAATDHPCVTSGGTIANPTAKPDTSSLSAKQMESGANGSSSGATDTPNAKPDDRSLSGQEMKQNPGASK